MEPTITQDTARAQFDYDIDYQLERIAAYTNQLTWMRKHMTALVHLRTYGITVSFYGEHADFNYLTHPQIVELMKAFPGHYTKKLSYGKDSLDYTLDTPVDGLQIRAYSGEPPSACVIEEHIEYVVIPARTERKVTRKVICPEPTQPENAQQNLA